MLQVQERATRHPVALTAMVFVWGHMVLVAGRSPAVTAVAAMLPLLIAQLLIIGRQKLRRVLFAIVSCVLVVIALNATSVGHELTRLLQVSAVRMAGVLLDAAGVLHDVGTSWVDSERGRRHLHAETSGSTAWLALCTTALFWAFVVRRPQIILLGLVTAASLSFVVGNAAWLAVTSVDLYERLRAATEGWRVDVPAALCLFSSFTLPGLLVASADGLLCFLFAPVPVLPREWHRGRLVRCWNRLVEGPPARRRAQRRRRVRMSGHTYYGDAWQAAGLHLAGATRDLMRLWCSSRPFPPLVHGLPCLCVAATLLAAVLIADRSRGRLLSSYQAAAEAAIDAHRPAAAWLLKRAAALHPSHSQTLFLKARWLHLAGDLESASELMDRIAPKDAPGHVAAHLWQARRLSELGRALSREECEVLQFHLRCVVAQQPDSLEAHTLLGRLFWSQQRWQQAAEHLQRVVDQRPQLRNVLARCWLRAGDERRARREAQRAAEHWRQWLEKTQVLVANEPVERAEWRVQAYLLCAEADVLRNDLQAAETGLRDAVERTGDGRCRTALAKLYLHWSDLLAAGGDVGGDAGGGAGGADAERHRRLLSLALRADPGCPGVVERLALLAMTEGDSTGGGSTGGGSAERDSADRNSADLTERWISSGLQKMLGAQELPASVLAMLGSRAAQHGQLMLARDLLEQAYARGSRSPLLLNNLAWVTFQVQPDRAAWCLQLVESALAVVPERPELRETRGQILRRLGRHHEALDDLEYALQYLPRHRALHEGLVEVYRQIGRPELAAAHARWDAD